MRRRRTASHDSADAATAAARAATARTATTATTATSAAPAATVGTAARATGPGRSGWPDRRPDAGAVRVAGAILVALGLALAGAAGAAAQVTGVKLVDRGTPVPVRLTGDEVRMGRAAAHALLASAHRDVTRPITDEEVEALGKRGTLLRIRLAAPEDVLLLRLRARARPSRLAAYVPPDRDDRAFVFLGGSVWERIVVVTLPEQLREAVRRARS